MQKKVLFIAGQEIGRSPSQRFRFEQYFNFLKENGFESTLSPLLLKSETVIFYSKGHFIQKIIIIFRSISRRIRDVFRSHRFDIIFIQREAFMLGTAIFEKLLQFSRAKIVFDFDDAIWIHDVSEANRKFGWLKNPKKTSKIIEISDLIFAGNQYLAEYALNFNPNVKIIPTTIDTDQYTPLYKRNSNTSLCIGWSGSHTTMKHFHQFTYIWERALEKYKDRIHFKVIGDAGYKNSKINVQGIAWTAEDELEEIRSFDIGIMPLPDDQWTQGKCGLKGLLYMALEVPTIMSPVGVNQKIITDGENGFLASNESEWLKKLSLLIESETLRKQLGQAGRKTVIEHYSVNSQKNRYLEYLRGIL